MAKHAIITGAASGIGLAIAHRLLADGWTLTGIDRQDQPVTLADTAWVTCNLADRQAVARIITGLAAHGADALILCAGIAGLGSVAQVLRINFLANRQLFDGLASSVRGGGSITIMSSAAGWRWSEHISSLKQQISEPDDEQLLILADADCATAADAYVRSKELLCAMVASRCLEQWSRGVRLNSVSPGGVSTPLTPDFTLSMGEDAMSFASRLVGRHATASEIADVVAFLTSPDARWINGADIRVDGGLVGALASGTAEFGEWSG